MRESRALAEPARCEQALLKRFPERANGHYSMQIAIGFLRQTVHFLWKGTTGLCGKRVKLLGWCMNTKLGACGQLVPAIRSSTVRHILDLFGGTKALVLAPADRHGHFMQTLILRLSDHISNPVAESAGWKANFLSSCLSIGSCIRKPSPRSSPTA